MAPRLADGLTWVSHPLTTESSCPNEALLANLHLHLPTPPSLLRLLFWRVLLYQQLLLVQLLWVQL